MTGKTKKNKALRSREKKNANSQHSTPFNEGRLPHSPASNKRSLPKDQLRETTSSTKRQKQALSEPSRNAVPSVRPTSISTKPTQIQQIALPAKVDPRIPFEVRHLSSKYTITTMSILSSAKMSQKISLVLERIGKSTSAALKLKPGAVVLYAKAAVVSKMISIVEIVKKEIEREGGKWWQYSKLEGRIEALKIKKPKQAKSVRSVDNAEEKSRGNADGNQSAKTTLVPRSEGSEAGKVVLVKEFGAGEAFNVDDEEDGEEAFETMALPLQAKTEEERKKIRNIAVMTIYIARVPIPGLKELYG
ncbi:MAG: hypothetical protein Q9164_005708, partial [Protoblastenia rupestris]